MPYVDPINLERLYLALLLLSRLALELCSEYPRLAKLHSYFYKEQNLTKNELLFTQNMQGSGIDILLALGDTLAEAALNMRDIPLYHRMDEANVGSSVKWQTELFYDRAVNRVRVFYGNEYDQKCIFEMCPFLTEDVLFNSTLTYTRKALRRMANIHGNLGVARVRG